jgi:expansin (peptidoglycan-binding protein)
MALGACGWDNDEDDYVAAINHVQYGNFTPSKDSPVCGACLLVYGPKGSVQVKAVDLCPECSKGDLDLSPAAFDKIADADVGRVPIVWKGC